MPPISITLLSNGQPIDFHDHLVAVDVQRSLNRIPKASLAFIDGELAHGPFSLSTRPILSPGQVLDIQMAEQGKSPITVFAGMIVAQRIEARTGHALLHIELRDAAIRMTQVRRSRIFRNMTDTDVILEMIDTHGLTAEDITRSDVEHPELVQYEATDWDFMLLRAEANGYVVAVNDGAISIKPPEASGAPDHSFTYGLDRIHSFEFMADAREQHTHITGVGWDLREQAATTPTEPAAFSLPQGDWNGPELADHIGFPPSQLTTMVPLQPGEAAAWASGRAMQSRLALLRGKISLDGMPEPLLLDLMELIGFSEHFDGVTLVTGVRHHCDATQGWRTYLQFGLSAEPFATHPNIHPAPAGGLLPAARGLQLAVVDTFEEDPDGELRVRVRLGSVGTDEGPVWARMSRPDAGAQRGIFFTPEPGDEVVVGFLNSDPRHPVILGALHSSTAAHPPTLAAPSEQNIEKGIVTRAGTTLRFIDDDPPGIAIETPAGNTLRLSDADEEISLEDQHGNKIVMNSDGITLESAGDLTLIAGGNVEIEGAQVDVK